MQINNLEQFWITTAEYYLQAISKTTIRMFAADLKGVEVEEAMRAFKTYRDNPANTKIPFPAQIKQLVYSQRNNHRRGRELPEPQGDPKIAKAKIAQIVESLGRKFSMSGKTDK